MTEEEYIKKRNAYIQYLLQPSLNLQDKVRKNYSFLYTPCGSLLLFVSKVSKIFSIF